MVCSGGAVYPKQDWMFRLLKVELRNKQKSLKFKFNLQEPDVVPLLNVRRSNKMENVVREPFRTFCCPILFDLFLLTCSC